MDWMHYKDSPPCNSPKPRSSDTRLNGEVLSRMRKHTMLENANHHSNIPHFYGLTLKGLSSPVLKGAPVPLPFEPPALNCEPLWRMRKVEFDDDLKNTICIAHNSHSWLTTHIMEWP
eukprot:scaffold23040_cov73-Skeletonema_dohrnii-CCMP3373.AAC.2